VSARQQARQLAELREKVVEVRWLPGVELAGRADEYLAVYNGAPWWVLAWSHALTWHLDQGDRAALAAILDPIQDEQRAGYGWQTRQTAGWSGRHALRDGFDYEQDGGEGGDG
jgi:hypothetical protein